MTRTLTMIGILLLFVPVAAVAVLHIRALWRCRAVSQPARRRRAF